VPIAEHFVDLVRVGGIVYARQLVPVAPDQVTTIVLKQGSKNDITIMPPDFNLTSTYIENGNHNFFTQFLNIGKLLIAVNGSDIYVFDQDKSQCCTHFI